MPDFRHAPGDRVRYRDKTYTVVRRTTTEERRCYWITRDIIGDAATIAVDRPTLDACKSISKANRGHA